MSLDFLPSATLEPRMKRSRRIVLASLAGLLLVVLSGLAAAQEEHGKKTKSWLDLFKTTGFVGYLLLGCSLGGTTLVIQYLVSLKRERLAPEVLSKELEDLIEEKRYDEALTLCDEEPGYLSTLVGSALRMRHAGYEEMIGVLEETFKINAKISYLSLLGNVAPLLGLLGTVTGMISSFQVIESLKAPTPGDLARGVYESLVNTTMGLFLAILFLTIFFFFKNKVTAMTLSVNLQAVDMLKAFAGGGHAS
jgi:biopolymer transport protein ExbB